MADKPAYANMDEFISHAIGKGCKDIGVGSYFEESHLWLAFDVELTAGEDVYRSCVGRAFISKVPDAGQTAGQIQSLLAFYVRGRGLVPTAGRVGSWPPEGVPEKPVPEENLYDEQLISRLTKPKLEAAR